MIRLFISYTQGSTGEYALARALERRLRERGIEVFRDETSISPGEEWREVLRERLSVWATHVLFIVSGAAWSSEFVRYEMQLAEERVASHNLSVLWLSFNRESGLSPTHWLNRVQSLHVQDKRPPHILESEWVSAVEGALGIRFGLPGLSTVFAEYVEKKTSGFVGRGHIFAEIRKFLDEKKSGYASSIVSRIRIRTISPQYVEKLVRCRNLLKSNTLYSLVCIDPPLRMSMMGLSGTADGAVPLF